MEIAGHLPWPAGLVLAGALYGACHLLASASPASPTDVGQLGVFAGRQLIATIARLFQYILPLAILVGVFGFPARTTQTQAQAEVLPSVSISLPATVPSETVQISYFLVGPFGGYGAYAVSTRRDR